MNWAQLEIHLFKEAPFYSKSICESLRLSAICISSKYCMGVSLSDTRRDNANETNQSATFLFYLSALVQRRCVAPGSAGWNV